MVTHCPRAGPAIDARRAAEQGIDRNPKIARIQASSLTPAAAKCNLRTKGAGLTGRPEQAQAPPAPTEQLELVVVVGDALKVIALPERGTLSLGRDKTCDVRIDSLSVSRRHALLHLPPALAIEDVGSRNGTFVAEKSVAGEATAPLRRFQRDRIALSVGERVNLGTATIVVRRAAMGPRDAAAAVQAIVLDPVMKELHAQVRRAARGQINILFLGETGVGKEVFAREVHAASARARGAFVALDCSTLPLALAEDHLFGHERSSFTGADRERIGYFEAAHNGTLFLDEVGELPLELQVKFLRVLEERAVVRVGGRTPRSIDVRIVAASNRNLHDEAARGAFRVDLLHRIDSLTIEIPPLRQRPTEIEALAERFILRFARMLDREPPLLPPETLALLRSFAWPGNVRELRNVIERAVTLCQGRFILPEDLPPRLSNAQRRDDAVPGQEPAVCVQGGPRAAIDPERDRIVAALQACAGNQTRAAALLHMPLRTLVNRIGELGLPRPRKARRD
ncbi:MAG: sigma 54-interacting transcriptional regulator [Deltaproteobacteria bacterium]